MFLIVVSALLQSAACQPLDTTSPLESGSGILYQTSVNGEVLDMLMRIEIVSATGLITAFRQGGGPTPGLIEMSSGTPLRGFGGPAFMRSAGSGDRRREWSYSPSPDEVLETLDIGEHRDIHVRQRNGAAGETYVQTVRFDRCDMLDIDGQRYPANVYAVSRQSDDGALVYNRTVWLSSATGWWLRESDAATGVETRAISFQQ